MDDVITALVEQQRELSGLLHGLDDRGWARPSRCDGWSVADVVLHVAQTNEMAIGSLTERFVEAMAELTQGLEPAANIDDGADLMVRRERGTANDAVLERFESKGRELVELLRASDPHRRVPWVAGELSTRTLATTRLAETWIHTGDVAHALGVELAPTERLRHIARLAWRTLPYAFARAGRTMSGPVAFELEGPSGSSWTFRPDEPTLTTITGPGVDLVLVAARRVDPTDTTLRGEGPDAEGVLELVRTYA